jgi:ribosomal protein S18 acetylase RimI-like enzyme
MDIRALGPGDEDAVRAAAILFDSPPLAEATSAFLHDPRHCLLLAYEDGQPAGFVSGVEMTHPDKGTEMFLYELGVDEAFRRRGIATALVTTLRDLAVARGCYGMWVLTDHDNEAALATYRRAGAGAPQPQVMLEWGFLNGSS